jgi:RNA polymerase sigma-B factor
VVTEADGPLDTGSSDDVERLFAHAKDDPGARGEFIERFAPLAAYLARRFSGRGEPVEDLIQVANLGLVKAVDRFDAERGVRFSTYATATILGELKRHFRDRTWAIRVPRSLQESGMAVNRAVGDLHQELARPPTVAEIARRTGLAEEAVLEAMEALQAYSTVSLDAPAEDDRTRLERIGGPDETLELLESWASLAPYVRDLPPRERRLLYLRFFEDKTQAEIAAELGISQMHVSRLLTATLGRLSAQVQEKRRT